MTDAPTFARAQAAGYDNGNGNGHGFWRTFAIALLTILMTSTIAGTTVKCGVDDVQTEAINANSTALSNMAIRMSVIERDVSEIKSDVKTLVRRTP